MEPTERTTRPAVRVVVAATVFCLLFTVGPGGSTSAQETDQAAQEELLRALLRVGGQTDDAKSDGGKEQPVSKPAPAVAPEPEPKAVPKPTPKVIPKAAPKVVPKPVTKTAPEPMPKVVPKPMSKVAPEPATKVAPKPAVKVVPKPATKLTPEPATKVVPKPEPKVSPKPARRVVPKPAPEIAPKLRPVVAPAAEPTARDAGPRKVVPVREDEVTGEVEGKRKVDEGAEVKTSVATEFDPSPEVIDREGRIAFKVYFESGSHSIVHPSPEVTEQAIRQIKALGRTLNREPLRSARILIAGHTDSSRGEVYDQRLARLRAETVLDYLVEEVGVDESRLSAIGYGSGQPLPGVTQATEEGRQAHRRVEFINLDLGE